MPNKLTQIEAENKINIFCITNNYKLYESFIYINNRMKITLQCNIDNFIWKPVIKDIFNYKTGCARCAENEAPSQQIANDNINNKCINKNYMLLEPFMYKNRKSIIKLKCLNDNYEWNSTYQYFIYDDSGCRRCTNNEKPTQQQAEEIVQKRCVEMNYILLEPFYYKNRKTIIKLKCLNDNNEWSLRYMDFLSTYNGCPLCNLSKGENKIKKILDDNNIKYIHQQRFKDCKDKKLLSFDFYLPELNTCIEFDGRQHFEIVERWGGEDTFKDRQRKDLIKTNYCLNNNIKLIRIRYDENIEEIILNILNS